MCIAEQIALTVTSLIYSYFKKRNLGMCMLFHAKNSVTFYTQIQTKTHLHLFASSILVLYILWLFICHPDIYTCRHSYFFYHLHSLISQISDCVSNSQTFMKLMLSFTPIIMQRSTLITFYSVWENRNVKDFDTSIIKDQRHLITRVNNFLTLLKNFANCNFYTLLTSSCRASLISRL